MKSFHSAELNKQERCATEMVIEEVDDNEYYQEVTIILPEQCIQKCKLNSCERQKYFISSFDTARP